MLFKSNLYQRPSLQTLSNAFSKSINAQNILFFFLFLRISKKYYLYLYYIVLDQKIIFHYFDTLFREGVVVVIVW
jgi:hypothetical protein